MLHVRTGESRVKDRQRGDRTVTLRIKKEYFDAILVGQKKIERRILNKYYQSLFLAPFNKLKLHYQDSERQLTVEVIGLKIEEIEETSVFCLSLGQILDAPAV